MARCFSGGRAFGETREDPEEDPRYYWVGVEFVGVDEGLRKEITQRVFDVERNRMRKSLS